jgi:hypothetical protein
MRRLDYTVQVDQQTIVTLFDEDGTELATATFMGPPSARVPTVTMNPILESKGLPLLSADEIDQLRKLMDANQH